jgi:hypothetical protein
MASLVWGGPLAGWMRGGEVGSPMWARIRVMGSGSVRGRSEAETAVGGLGWVHSEGRQRDGRERRLTGRAEQGKHLIDPCQEGGPRGGTRGGCVRWLAWRLLWPGRRGRRSQGKLGIRARELSGEGIILLGPFGDEGPQGRVGGEDAVVAVAVEPGWRKDLGEGIEELESRETQRGAAGGIGFRQDVENLVRAAADQAEPFESKRWSGTIPNQPFQPLPVGGLDADAGVEAEPTTVIPGEHVLGVVGLEEAVADHVAEDPFSHRVLEALQELVGESCGFVETEAGFWMGGRILSRVTLNLLEEPVHDAQVIVVVRIEARAEAMQESDRAPSCGSRSRGTGLPQGGPKGPEQDVEDGAGGVGPVVEEGPETFGHGEDELAHGYVGEDVVHQVGCGLGHALGAA